MFSFVMPDASNDEHKRLLAIEEEWVQSLGLAYRVVNVCIGELGVPADGNEKAPLERRLFVSVLAGWV
jgi:seryl-tRNA synthetase